MTNTSLTPVTAIVSMPFALIAAAFFRKPGMWILWQVRVKAPGTANSTTFLPLKSSSVVLGLRPSGRHDAECRLGHAIADLDGHGLCPLIAGWLELIRRCEPIVPLREGPAVDAVGSKRNASSELVEPVWHLDRRVVGDRRQRERGAGGLGARAAAHRARRRSGARPGGARRSARAAARPIRRSGLRRRDRRRLHRAPRCRR